MTPTTIPTTTPWLVKTSLKEKGSVQGDFNGIFYHCKIKGKISIQNNLLELRFDLGIRSIFL